MDYKIKERTCIWPLVFLVFISHEVLANQVLISESALKIVDILNSILIIICWIFIMAIVVTLRDRRLFSLLKSAHFFMMKSVITAWTLMGSAILFYTIGEILLSFDLITDVRAYRILKTLFAAVFAAGLFIQYKVILRYIKQK